MYDNILVPLDGSTLAEAILPYVSALARGLGARTTLVSVIDADAQAFRGRESEQETKLTSPSRLIGAAKEQAKEYLDDLSRRLGLEGERVVVVGKPAESIVAAQREHGCDLIAMSTHGRTGIARGIMGSVTDKVLRMSDVPLLVLRPRESGQTSGVSTLVSAEAARSLQTVIVPLDGSELSESALPHAEELARRLSMEMLLVQAVSVRMEDVFFGGGFYVDPTPLERELVEYAEQYLASVRKRLQDRGIRADYRTVLDLPAQAVIQVAKDTPNSLIAMSTRGQSGLTRWILGSTTEKVVGESGVPVLVVPPKQSE